MNNTITLADTIGLAKTDFDAHTLGVATINEFLTEFGFKVVVANSEVSKAITNPGNIYNSSLIEKWIINNNIKALGFSYRLNVNDAVLIFQKLMYQL